MVPLCHCREDFLIIFPNQWLSLVYCFCYNNKENIVSSMELIHHVLMVQCNWEMIPMSARYTEPFKHMT